MLIPRIVHVVIFVALVVPGLSKKPKECRQVIRDCDPSYKYRTIDGSCNNINNPTWAMALTPYYRLLPNRYSDGVHKMPKSTSGKELPLARKISNVMDPPENRSDTEYTIGFMQFGQILTHDITRLGLLEEIGCPMQATNDPCYKVGDNRVQQNPELATLHVAYYRYHNVIAKLLEAINPHWDDEKLYQEARRINIAMYQHVVYNEYIPRMIGEDYSCNNKLKCKSTSCVDDYNRETDASMILEFASAAFRAPHTSVVGNLQLVDENRRVIGDIRLSDVINKPSVVENRTRQELNYDNFVRGMSHQPQDRADSFNVETKQFIFKGTGKFGLDLRSSDIQRDRDHGVGWYTKARKLCNLYVPQTFEDLNKIMSTKNANKLKSLYDRVQDIELSVGGLAEPIIDGTRVGETNRCLMNIQFYRTRTGDRFFYENCERHSFTEEQLKVIRKATFACLLCDTSYKVDKMQPSAFDLVGRTNQLTPCNQLCKLNLDAWKEKCPQKC